jgi:hypothetical protein
VIEALTKIDQGIRSHHRRPYEVSNFALFDVASQVKLTIMIEDPRDVERKRLLGIEDPDELTRDDLADALVEVIYSL